MRTGRAYCIAIACFFVVAGSSATADLLFDNYLPNPDGGWDNESFFTSELDAAVAGPNLTPGSWAADDIVLGPDLTIESIRWLAIRKPGYTYTAEAIILDSTFATLHHFTDLAFATLWADPAHPVVGFTPYEGEVQLPAGGVALPAGHYYVAVRLVSRTATGALGGGRNMMLTTSTGDPNYPTNPDGLTEGAVWCPSVGLNNWTMISGFGGPSATTDYAYRIYGTPEPAGLMLLAGGLLLLRKR